MFPGGAKGFLLKAYKDEDGKVNGALSKLFGKIAAGPSGECSLDDLSWFEGLSLDSLSAGDASVDEWLDALRNLARLVHLCLENSPDGTSIDDFMWYSHRKLLHYCLPLIDGMDLDGPSPQQKPPPPPQKQPRKPKVQPPPQPFSDEPSPSPQTPPQTETPPTPSVS
jgi:hypothetical protein